MLDQRAGIVATALLVVMAAAAARVLADLPLDAPLAIHFNAAGQADGWAPAWLALSVMPLIALGVIGFALLLPGLEPRGGKLLHSASAVSTIFISLLGVLAAIQLVIAATALQVPVQVPRIAATAVGLLFILGGNVMGKLRWNHTVGIRTPWTLASERVWDRTHRFAGRLFVAAGAVIAAAAWWAPAHGHEEAIIVTGTVAVAVLPILRSFQLARGQRE